MNGSVRNNVAMLTSRRVTPDKISKPVAGNSKVARTSTLPDVRRTRVNTIPREPLTARLASSISCCRIALFSAMQAFSAENGSGPFVISRSPVQVWSPAPVLIWGLCPQTPYTLTRSTCLQRRTLRHVSARSLTQGALPDPRLASSRDSPSMEMPSGRSRSGREARSLTARSLTLETSSPDPLLAHSREPRTAIHQLPRSPTPSLPARLPSPSAFSRSSEPPRPPRRPRRQRPRS